MPDFATLKDKQRAIRAEFPETLGLRVHRAISWIGRAEACGDDLDARFIFLWIGFNAAYADEQGLEAFSKGERGAMSEYFDRLVSFDATGAIQDALWREFQGPVRDLMLSKYLYHPFWQHHNGVPGFENWFGRFGNSARAFTQAFSRRETARVLSFVFDRLYVLRNQIVHGGATWNSAVNRGQVRDGSAILGVLLPAFVNIMMDNPHADWGRPFYPVVA